VLRTLQNEVLHTAKAAIKPKVYLPIAYWRATTLPLFQAGVEVQVISNS
jgi:hypothetical protein